MGAALNSVFQFFARFEFDHVGGFDFDHFSGLGIATFAGFATGFLESAESYQGYFPILLLQCFGEPLYAGRAYR